MVLQLAAPDALQFRHSPRCKIFILHAVAGSCRLQRPEGSRACQGSAKSATAAVALSAGHLSDNFCHSCPLVAAVLSSEGRTAPATTNSQIMGLPFLQ